MAKRKDFRAGDSGQESSRADIVRPARWSRNPEETRAYFDPNASSIRSFDFGPWYDGHIDAVTRACQQAVTAMLKARQRSHATIVSYCRDGLSRFFPFCQTWASALGRPLTLGDIDRALLDHFLQDLKSSAVSEATQKDRWHAAKAVLKRLVMSGWIEDPG